MAVASDLQITVPGIRRQVVANALAQSIVSQQEQLDKHLAAGTRDESTNLAQAGDLVYLRELATLISPR